MKKFFALALSLAIAVRASADWSPIGFGVVGLEGGQMPSPDDSVCGLNIGIIHSAHEKTYGLSFVTFAAFYDDAAGLHLAGIVNSTKYAKNGVLQVAAGGNQIEWQGDGIQLSGLMNDAKNFNGLQVAYINISRSSGTGAQFGFLNAAASSSDYSGVQVGVVNFGIDPGGFVSPNNKITGLQIGALNIDANFTGLQLGAINSANFNFTGVQIGAINYVGGVFKGVQIGAINIVASSDIAVLPILRVAF